MREEVKRWIEQTEADLRTANNSLKSKDYYASAFWSQQAVEKILKAFIIKRDNKLIKIHNLVILGRIAGLSNELLKNCEKLSEVYIESRYGILGDDVPYKKFSEKEAAEFINISKEVVEWLKNKI